MGKKCAFYRVFVTDFSHTVVTPNKGQFIFGKIESNKGIAQIPLFVIFDEWSNTVVTPNKGQSIFGKLGSNKGISEIPLFVIFDKWY